MKGIALSIRSAGIGKLIKIPQGRFDKIWKLQTQEGMQTPSPTVSDTALAMESGLQSVILNAERKRK